MMNEPFELLMPSDEQERERWHWIGRDLTRQQAFDERVLDLAERAERQACETARVLQRMRAVPWWWRYYRF